MEQEFKKTIQALDVTKVQKDGLTRYFEKHGIRTLAMLENKGSKLGATKLFGIDYFSLLTKLREAALLNEVEEAQVVSKKPKKKRTPKPKPEVENGSN